MHRFDKSAFILILNALFFATLFFCSNLHASENDGCHRAIMYLNQNTKNTDPIKLTISKEQKTAVLGSDDPVSVIERPKNIEIFKSSFHKLDYIVDDYKGIYCAHLLIAFSVTRKSSDISSYLKSADSGFSIFRASLFNAYTSLSEAEQSLRLWKKQLYNIPVVFNKLDSKDIATLEPEYFTSIRFFNSSWAGNTNNVMFRKTTHVDPFATIAIPASTTNIVLCSINCDELFALIEPPTNVTDRQFQSADSADQNPRHRNEKGTPIAGQESHNGQNKSDAKTEETPSAHTKHPAGNELLADTTAQNGSTHQSSNNTESVHAQFKIQLSGGNKNSLEEFGLHCVIQALDIKNHIFTRELQCNENRINLFRNSPRGENYRIEVNDSERWALKATPKPKPQNVDFKVVLPAGVKGSACAMVATVRGHNQQYVPFAANADTELSNSRSTFTVSIPYEYVDQDNTLTVTLTPDIPANCGGVERTVIINTTENTNGDLEIPFVHESSLNYALHYVFLPNTSKNKNELHLNEQENLTFGRNLVESVFSSLNRSAAFSDDSPRVINHVAGTLLGHTSPDKIFDLDSDRLTNNRNLSIANLQIGEYVHRLADNSFLFRQDGKIGSLLSQQSQEISELGFNRVRSIVLGLILNNSTSIPTDPCLSFDSIADDVLIDGNAWRGEIDVFPIIKLKEQDEVNVSNLIPVSINTIAPTSVGGLYRCSSVANENVNIYPFYVEPWRDPSDVLPRYKVALTDQLYRFIEDIEND